MFDQPIRNPEDHVSSEVQKQRARDFARADAIRQQLADMGIVLKDSAQGTQWERA